MDAETGIVGRQFPEMFKKVTKYVFFHDTHRSDENDHTNVTSGGGGVATGRLSASCEALPSSAQLHPSRFAGAACAFLRHRDLRDTSPVKAQREGRRVAGAVLRAVDPCARPGPDVLNITPV